MLCIIAPECQSAADEQANQRSTAESGEEPQKSEDGQETQDESDEDERFLSEQVV